MVQLASCATNKIFVAQGAADTKTTVSSSLSLCSLEAGSSYRPDQLTQNGLLRICSHDQNFVPLIICNKIVNKCPFLSNEWPSISNTCPSLSNKCPSLSNEFPKFLRQNHDSRDIYLQEGHIFVPFWPCVRALITGQPQKADLESRWSKCPPHKKNDLFPNPTSWIFSFFLAYGRDMACYFGPDNGDTTLIKPCPNGLNCALIYRRE